MLLGRFVRSVSKNDPLFIHWSQSTVQIVETTKASIFLPHDPSFVCNYICARVVLFAQIKKLAKRTVIELCSLHFGVNASF